MSAEEAQSIVDTEEVISPDQSFSSAFDDLEEKEEETTEEQSEETTEVEEEEAEETTEAEETSDEVEEKTEEVEEETELSALDQAEKFARDKFLKNKKGKEEEDDTAEKTEEVKEAAPSPKIDFTDVDSDPGKFVQDIIGDVKDTAQKARWEEANTAYPEFGEMMTAITRKLIDRQDVKFVDGQAVQVPENVQEQFDSMAELKGLVDSMQVELDERKYFDAIEAEVPGAKAISGSKEFISWLDGQSVGINSLADSGDPVDAVQVMKAYNEHKAHQTAKVVDEAALKKKKKNVSSLRPAVKTSPSRDRGNNQDDFDGAFNS